MSKTQTPAVEYSVTLADGTTYSRQVPKLPQAWMSAAMRLAPYGTDFRGAVYTRTRLSDGLTKSWPPAR